MPINLTPKRQELLQAKGHLLVLGGPGCGKTTIALLKADHEATSGALKAGQKILFLSFARSTIARVAQQAGNLPTSTRAVLEINTYHGFIWKLLRSHGYLLQKHGEPRLLPPPQAAAKLAKVRGGEARRAEMKRLFEEEGTLHFDLFAASATQLLSRSAALRGILCDAYPLIIVDEFQDTDAHEWALIKAFGESGVRLIALADAEQRIYEFRGADPRRIGEFSRAFHPEAFDFGEDNYRSDGRDITTFGNDLIRGGVRGKHYNDVKIRGYGFYQGKKELFPLKTAVLDRTKKLREDLPKNWSLAVLVSSKALMLRVSDYLGSEDDGLPAVAHEVAVDAEGPSLAAAMIARILQGAESVETLASNIVADLCDHIRGRRGAEEVPQGELKLVDALGEHLQSGKAPRGANRIRIVEGARAIALARFALELTGRPEEDWLAIRRLLGNVGVEEYLRIAEEAKYIRLLHRGAALRTRLGDLWRQHQAYPGAIAAVEDALVQEHFSSTLKEWRGVHVMTMHKSKGKEFSEVVIFEGRHSGRLVRTDSEKAKAQSILTLRVAVTRAMRRTTIVTPNDKRCPLL